MLPLHLLLSTLVIVSVSAHPNETSRVLPKKVYTTNYLPGFRRDFPSIWPPGIGGIHAADRVIIDIGANNGDQYTLLGRKNGHTVFSFEPSPMVATLFRGVMRQNKIDVSYVKIRNNVFKKFQQSDKKVKVPAGADSDKPKVYLLPVALSNRTGVVLFHESPCRNLSKCGKVNHIVSDGGAKQSKIRVPAFRLDDISLPIEEKKVWFVKIDVEGHELEVVQGARGFFRKRKVPYVAIEFSNNGRSGIDWGVELLEEMHSQGYVCHHLRGFGRCHDASYRSPSMKCNYPFDVDDWRKAPSFEEYTEVFELRARRKKRAMADLMCIHERVLNSGKKAAVSRAVAKNAKGDKVAKNVETLDVAV